MLALDGGSISLPCPNTDVGRNRHDIRNTTDSRNRYGIFKPENKNPFHVISAISVSFPCERQEDLNTKRSQMFWALFTCFYNKHCTIVYNILPV